MTTRRAGPRLAALLLGGACFGCGVTNYETQMGHEQARLDYLDRENQLLEGPMKWPEKKEDPAKKDETKAPEGIQAYEVFFRPPRGISTVPQPAGPNLHRLAAAQGPQGAFQEVLLVVAKGKGKDAFRTDALKDLAAGNRVEDKNLTPPGRPPLLFEQYRADATGLTVFVYHDEAFQAAIAFRWAKADPATMDVSLGSLALGRNAAQQHGQYNLRKAPAK